jgi:hypothetical protein
MTDMPVDTTEGTIVRGVLDQWKSAVDAHEPQRIAELFTDGAIFQGLHRYTVGQAGIAEYYDSQPLHMTATYRVLETRRMAADLVLGYVGAEFSYIDRPPVHVFLSVLVRQTGAGLRLDHYQVSRLP